MFSSKNRTASLTSSRRSFVSASPSSVPFAKVCLSVNRLRPGNKNLFKLTKHSSFSPLIFIESDFLVLALRRTKSSTNWTISFSNKSSWANQHPTILTDAIKNILLCKCANTFAFKQSFKKTSKLLTVSINALVILFSWWSSSVVSSMQSDVDRNKINFSNKLKQTVIWHRSCLSLSVSTRLLVLSSKPRQISIDTRCTIKWKNSLELLYRLSSPYFSV